MTKQANAWWQKRWLQWTAGVLALLGIAALIVMHYVATHAEPILRKRIIATVSDRFHSPVELDRIDISTMKGLQVTGEGLRVLYIAGADHPSASNPSRPMLTVQHFQFRTDIRSLFRATTHVGVVYVTGLEVHIPAAEDRGPLLHQHASDTTVQPSRESRFGLFVSHIICDNATLFIETNKPGKDPLQFEIQHLDLTGMNWRKPFHYDALLTNPKPVGLIHAVGAFGPWQNDNPRATPIDGDYNFDHANLDTIKGIGGMLSSTGHFAGTLGSISVDGVTDTPDFSIDTSNHPVPLHTQFHAIVDGTTGDTTLDPVRAHLLHSDFTARGTVMRVKGKGHDIALDVDMPSARIEDMLRLAVKTDPPLMRGALGMKTKLHIPPGPARVAEKIELNGNFSIRQVAFSNPSVQDKVDGLSMRAQGKPKEAKEASTDKVPDVASEMRANFTLGHAMTTVTDLHYQVPGALVLLNGVYSLDGAVFEFKGHVRTDATASQMTTGWKAMLLKPIDAFLKKHGAGLEVPVQISGTKGEPHFGLALHGANESVDDMKQDVKSKTKDTPKKK